MKPKPHICHSSRHHQKVLRGHIQKVMLSFLPGGLMYGVSQLLTTISPDVRCIDSPTREVQARDIQLSHSSAATAFRDVISSQSKKPSASKICSACISMTCTIAHESIFSFLVRTPACLGRRKTTTTTCNSKNLWQNSW